MKVIYNDIIYTLNSNLLNCQFFKALAEENIEEVKLTMYYDVFLKLLYGIKFEEENDFDNLFLGLSYFGADDIIKKLIVYLQDKIYNDERKILQKEIIDFFSENSDFLTYEICSNTSLNDEFFKNLNKDLYDWKLLRRNASLSPNFFKNIKPETPLDFANTSLEIDEYVDNIYSFFNPNIPSKYYPSKRESLSRAIESPYLSIKNIEEHLKNDRYDIMDYIEYFALNPFITEEFIEKYCLFVNKPFFHKKEFNYRIYRNPNISEKFFEKHLHEIDDLSELFQHPNITEKFIKKYYDTDYIYDIRKNINLSFQYRKDNKLMDWYSLCKNPNISIKLLEHFNNLRPNKLNWIGLCENTNLPVSFFKNHRDKVEWYILCKNHFNLEKRTLENVKNKRHFENDLLEKFVKTNIPHNRLYYISNIFDINDTVLFLDKKYFNVKIEILE